MIDIASLRPTDLKALDQHLSDKEFAQDFLAALVKFLNEARPDGGADSDRLFVIAVQLTNAKVWNHVDAIALAATCAAIPRDVMAVFCQGLPAQLASQLLAQTDDPSERAGASETSR